MLYAGLPPHGTKSPDGLSVTETLRGLPLATAPHLIAGWPKGVHSIATARLTAGPAGQLPGIGRTPITVLPDDIRKTQALTGGFVTVAVRAITVLLHRAQVVADTL